MPEITITNNGVVKLQKNLDASKATCPDEISARLLKEFATEFGSVLTDIFSKSINQCEVPKDWKQANVIPVFKKGEKYLASNHLASIINMHMLQDTGTYSSVQHPKTPR